ncbi:MAG: hypothetical protein Q8P25_03650 [Candidatus Curtissbacteria bacterium]|nr:hypothetical protein [Candidatus Curtissbacteria bacterium]
MTPIKTYTATIKVTFEVHKKENPRAIAKYMANCFNGMREVNLHAYGVMEKLIEETNGQNCEKKLLRGRPQSHRG